MIACVSVLAAAIALVSPKGTLTVDSTTGSILAVGDSSGRAVGWHNGSEGVFTLTFESGQKLTAADFATNGTLRVDRGKDVVTIAAERPEASVCVEIAATETGFDFRGAVTPKAGIVTAFATTGDMVFDPSGVSRVYFPQIGSEGPGLALKGAFFRRGSTASSFGWQGVATGGRAVRGVFKSNCAPTMPLGILPKPVRVTDEGRRLLDAQTVRFLEKSRFAVNRPTVAKNADCVLAESENGPFLCGSSLNGRGYLWRIGEARIKEGQSPRGSHPRLAAALCRVAMNATTGKVGIVSLTLGPLRGSMTGSTVEEFETAIRAAAKAAHRPFVTLRTPAEVAAARREGFAVIVNPYGESFPCEGCDKAALDRFAAEMRAYVGKGGHWIECGGLPFYRVLVPQHYLAYGGQYPKVFSDWFAVATTGGAECALYAVRPRPPHEPWKASSPFVTGWLGCSGCDEGGRLMRYFDCYVAAGKRWQAPTVRLRLDAVWETLAAYVRENDLTRPLSSKIPAEKLQTFKEAPLLKWQSRASEMIEVAPSLPAPSLVHISRYLKGGFDKEYPDHLPSNEKNFGTDAEHKAMIDVLHRAGHLYSPYTNPTWWCDEPKGPTFVQTGDAALKRDRKGQPRHEAYGIGAVGWTTTFWHPAVRAANRKTVRQFTQDLSVDLLFQDQCGARVSSFDFNPASPTPTAYIEGLLSMVEEDARVVPLGTEDGWDRVADSEAALCGVTWGTVPLKTSGGRLLNKATLPPATWEYELIAQRVMHDKTLFYMHDLGAFVTERPVLAWMFALGYQLSFVTDYAQWKHRKDVRDWYAGLCLLQKHVFSRIAGKRVTAFRHDRTALLARKDIDCRAGVDDGSVIAQFEDVSVAVNLSDVPREVDGHMLAPYGWYVTAPNLISSALEGEQPVVILNGQHAAPTRIFLFGGDAHARFTSLRYRGEEKLAPCDPARQYRNPIIGGMAADPSITRKGEWFYLANSSFCYFPGIPVYRSRDLVAWTFCGYVGDTPSKLALPKGIGLSGGVYAPDIKYNPYNDTFYLTVTITSAAGTLVYKTKDPSRGWSEPISIPVGGIDPSFFFEDAKTAWILNCDTAPENHPEYSGHRTIRIRKYDLVTDRCVPGTEKILVNKGLHPEKNPIWCEGPHLYKAEGRYYLMAAEGATRQNHSEVIWRATELLGPYAPCAVNPILTQRDLDPHRADPITSAGHADLIQIPDGSWMAVFLAIDPYQAKGKNWSSTGRNTYLLPVEWIGADAARQPIILAQGKTVPRVAEKTDWMKKVRSEAGAIPRGGNCTFADNFSSSRLDSLYFALRGPASFAKSDGGLCLTPTEDTLDSRGTPAYLARWIRNKDFTIEATFAYEVPNAGGSAGLCCYQNEKEHVEIAKMRLDGKVSVVVRETIKGVTRICASTAVSAKDALRVRLVVRRDRLTCFWAPSGGAWQPLGEALDATHLSTDHAGGYVGATYGPFIERSGVSLK